MRLRRATASWRREEQEENEEQSHITRVRTWLVGAPWDVGLAAGGMCFMIRVGSARSKRLTRDERGRLWELRARGGVRPAPAMHGDAVVMGNRTQLRTAPWL